MGVDHVPAGSWRKRRLRSRLARSRAAPASMKTIAFVLSIIALCVLAFALGRWQARREGAEFVLSHVQGMSVWRESEWQVAAIRYAEMIRLIRANQDPAAIDHACQEIARNLKNIGWVQPLLERPEGSERVPASVR